MAKNISPIMARENEVHGLIAWSVIPTRILFYLSLLISLQQLAFGAVALFYHSNVLMGTWQLTLAVAFLFMSFQVSLFSKKSQQYLSSEENGFLAKALSHLGGFWISYLITLFFSVAPLVAFLIRSFIGFDYQKLTLKTFLGVPALVVVVALSFFLSKENRFSAVQKSLTQYVESFANRNLSRTRTLTFVSVGIGILCIWAYLGDALLNTSLDKAAVAFSGAAYLFIGAAIGFVWRAVREIQRNPSLIYFERTMEKLNFFWLSTCIGFLIILVGNFF
jgi:hypothetical protein